MMPNGRLEYLLEQIRDALQEQAENTGNLNLSGIEEQLIELNKTMKTINAYLAQIASHSH